MHHALWVSTLIFLTDLVIRVGLSVRVIRRRLPVGSALAWLAVILIFPLAGALLYLLVGEYRLGPRRARRIAAASAARRAW
jgi:cardiolipin synthase